jgi:DUF2975 family protein
MSTISSSVGFDTVPALQSLLRARISWLCHLIRITALLWAGWILVSIVWGWYWNGPDTAAKVAENLGRFLNADLTGLSNAQVMATFVGALGLWLFDAAIVYCIWRLFGTYLRGRIFTVDAAIWLRRLGITGLAALLTEVVWRRLVLIILTGHAHVPAATLLLSGQLLIPFDLLRVLFCLFVVMLGQIFKTAAEMADDQARIV